MKEKVVCIFAHPDDEVIFGPAGTILHLSRSAEVHLISATSGDAGRNPFGGDLGKIREQELQESADILGVTQVHFLGFKDGSLCNNLYHAIAEKITILMDKIKPTTIITMEPRGISGHIDHITMSFISSYLFHKLPYIKKIMYHCRIKTDKPWRQDYFIYVPPGYDKNEVDQIVDVADVWDKKLKALQAHKSQHEDVDMLLENYKTIPKEEYFLVKEK